MGGLGQLGLANGAVGHDFKVSKKVLSPNEDLSESEIQTKRRVTWFER
jgi:hypothetical protein